MGLPCQINTCIFTETKNSVNLFRLPQTVYLLPFNQPRHQNKLKKKKFLEAEVTLVKKKMQREKRTNKTQEF